MTLPIGTVLMATAVTWWWLVAGLVAAGLTVVGLLAIIKLIREDNPDRQRDHPPGASDQDAAAPTSDSDPR